ncbi:MAG: DUF3592 domain-containing protein [Pseudomonadota bacterium]
MSPITTILRSKDLYLFRTDADGVRRVSWRAWLLIYLLPGLFLLAAVILAFETLLFQSRAQLVSATVVQVYSREGWTPRAGQTPVYSPVFTYTWRDGTQTRASNGMASENWDFEIGSPHEVWADMRRKGDVRLNLYERLWALPVIIALIGLGTLPFSLYATHLVRRWRRRGLAPPP